MVALPAGHQDQVLPDPGDLTLRDHGECGEMFAVPQIYSNAYLQDLDFDLDLKLVLQMEMIPNGCLVRYCHLKVNLWCIKWVSRDCPCFPGQSDC